MSSVRNVVLSGTVAAIIAIGLIAVALYIPGTGLLKSSTTPSTQSSGQTGQTGQSGQQGALAVLLTDPPTVPENVSALYIQYSEVQAHVADAGNQTGWYNLSGSGEINLMSVVNVSQTIANASLPAGKFNGLRFNVTSVTVSYSPDGQTPQNYTGLMIYGHNTLYVWVPGGISVTAAQTSAAMIDLTPTVVLAGTPSDPTFIFVPSARGYVIPTTSIPAEAHIIGKTIDLKNNSWWGTIEAQTKFGITSVSLTNHSLSVTVVNQGSASIDLKLVGVTTQTSLSGGMMSPLKTSDIFVVESNGSLVNMNTSTIAGAEAQIVGGGLLLAPGQSITLNYSGPIVIGLQFAMHFPKYVPPPVTPSSSYLTVWVMGNDKEAQAAVQMK